MNGTSPPHLVTVKVVVVVVVVVVVAVAVVAVVVAIIEGVLYKSKKLKSKFK